MSGDCIFLATTAAESSAIFWSCCVILSRIVLMPDAVRLGVDLLRRESPLLLSCLSRRNEEASDSVCIFDLDIEISFFSSYRHNTFIKYINKNKCSQYPSTCRNFFIQDLILIGVNSGKNVRGHVKLGRNNSKFLESNHCFFAKFSEKKCFHFFLRRILELKRKAKRL